MQDKTHLVDEITGHRRMRRNRKAGWKPATGFHLPAIEGERS